MKSSVTSKASGRARGEGISLRGLGEGTRNAHRRVLGGSKRAMLRGKAPRMLIVEDSPLIALDVAETMRTLGFDVRAPVLTYDEAMAEIERDVPDFAVIDLRLGVDSGDIAEDTILPGEDLLSMLSRQKCRCLVFSGDDAACRRIAGRYPGSSVVAKPAQPRKLARAIENLRRLNPS